MRALGEARRRTLFSIRSGAVIRQEMLPLAISMLRRRYLSGVGLEEPR